MCVYTFLPVSVNVHMYIIFNISITGVSILVHVWPPLPVNVDVGPHLSVGIHPSVPVTACVFFPVPRASLYVVHICKSARVHVSVSVSMAVPILFVHFCVCTSTCEGVGIYLRMQAQLYQGEQGGTFCVVSAAPGHRFGLFLVAGASWTFVCLCYV